MTTNEDNRITQHALSVLDSCLVSIVDQGQELVHGVTSQVVPHWRETFGHTPKCAILMV